MSQPKGTYSRGAGRTRRQKPPPSSWFHPRPNERCPPKPSVVPPGCVGVQPWGPLPAKPPPGRGTP